MENPSAFPTIGEHPIHPDDQGMTLRDYFAAKAMWAIISKSPYTTSSSADDAIVRERAYGAYVYADAMLKARTASKGEA